MTPSSSALVFSIPSAFASAKGAGGKAVWPFASSFCFDCWYGLLGVGWDLVRLQAEDQT